MRKRVFVFVAFFIVTSFLLSFAEQTTKNGSGRYRRQIRCC